MARFFRKDARMTTAVAPFPSVSPRVQMTARQRACLEQIARRQTSPQRLVRRAKLLLEELGRARRGTTAAYQSCCATCSRPTVA